jgi:hypothetical protein|tara:strand:- start:128 stop:418 length:291 start_codon:yes stop_codon:yes gene_type:complete
MFPEKLGTTTGTVNVLTTDNIGLDSDHWAERASSHIISISKDAPPAIRDQAEAFKENVHNVLRYYMKQAILSERTTICGTLSQKGHDDLADIIRRI